MVHVSSILIGVSNLEQARPFYEQVLGMTFGEFRPPFASVTLDGVEFNIEEDAPYCPSTWAATYIGGRKHVSFETDDLNTFLEEATRYGARVVQSSEEKLWGWKEAIIADQDGNEFIIEQEVWALSAR